MACDVDNVSDKPCDKVFKCCIKKKANVVTCIICGATYHDSCFTTSKRLKQSAIIDPFRIICCDYDLTSLLSEFPDETTGNKGNLAGVLVALKHTLETTRTELELFKSGNQTNNRNNDNTGKSTPSLQEYNRIKDLIEQKEYEVELIKKENTTLKGKLKILNAKLDSSCMEDTSVSIGDAPTENSMLREENNLLKEQIRNTQKTNPPKQDNTNGEIKHLLDKNELLTDLNQQLKDKNQLLTEKNNWLTEERDKNQANLSYARIVTSKSDSNKKVHIVQNLQPIIIRPKPEKEGPDTTNIDVKKAIDPVNLKLQISSFRQNKNGSVSIKCRNSTDSKTLLQELSKKLSDKYDIMETKLSNPKIRIAGIHEEKSTADIQQDIVKQNLDGMVNPLFVVTYIKKQRNGKGYVASAEVSPDVYLRIAEKDFKLEIGWQICPVYNDINIKRCYKCSQYGHNGNNCKSESHICKFCAQQHDSRNCTQTEPKKCTNCTQSNLKFKTNYSVTHAADDEDNCESYKERRSYIISRTNYPIKVS